MNLRLLFWASILIINLVIMGLAIRILALQSIPLSESLFVRGLSCLIIIIFFAYNQKLSLKPRSIKNQCIRAIIAGLALSLFSLSYNWLTASTVSVLSNIDVPLLIVLGPLVGIKASPRLRFASLVSILFLVWYVLGLEKQNELFYGLATLMTGCFLLCFGYLFIKKSMNEENYAITILVPSLAIIIYGLLERIVMNSPASTWTPGLLFIDILSGICMFFAYIATMQLYSLTDLAHAEFPTLISSLVIQPCEAVLFSMPLQIEYLGPSIAFVVMIYSILCWQKKLSDLRSSP